MAHIKTKVVERRVRNVSPQLAFKLGHLRLPGERVRNDLAGAYAPAPQS
jgi:hypothetical protein